MPVGSVRKDTTTQDKKGHFALCRNEAVPCSRFLPLEAQVLQKGDKTGFALEKDNKNQPAGPLGEGCQCNKPKSWLTSSPSSTKAWKQQNRAWYAPTVTITLVIGSRSRPSSFSKNWARTFTRGGWPCGVRGEWELVCRRLLNQGRTPGKGLGSQEPCETSSSLAASNIPVVKQGVTALGTVGMGRGWMCVLPHVFSHLLLLDEL